MEARVALALCVVLCGALSGRALSGSARRRAEALKSLAEAVKRLRVRMTSLFEPMQNALEHAGNPLLAMVAQAMSGGQSAGEAWRSVYRRATKRGGPADCLLDADREARSRLFEGLGQSGREEQDLLLSSSIEALEALSDAARAKLGEADRLYGTLGLLIGLMLALIVI